ncbi:uncharacterized protein N7483_000495 [Penicillium malachiteum]|uniref:uncharacterized protein n=1 Tax=Penicillium malachiteum TaxID=1324776 RepID=UPI00254805B6|nr:uncharacterized protein N7483_000495 [Penicillium malachiteum]KAJ5735370.1 hypothetical protein N7483_000495 [Penicillium malachiteum]
MPRSTGCRLCVNRRVKCDERTPGCARCETYGQPCPGYGERFKFITSKPYRTRRAQTKTEDRGARTSSLTSPRPSTSPNTSDSSSETCLEVQRTVAIPAPLISGDVNVIQSLGVFISDFTTSSNTSGNSNIALGSWFGFLPSIYGQNRALDAAIKSFSAHHFGQNLQNQQMMLYAQSAYGEALHWLRKALMNPSESLSSNVFCAVVLLCMYELFANAEDPASWMTHAKGLGQLVKVRGPECYRNQLDISLLKSARGLIVMHSMFSGEDCFLADEEWHNMMRQQHQLTTDWPQGYNDCIEQFFAYFTHSPRIVHNLYDLKDRDFSEPETLQQLSDALDQVLDMQTNMATWYENWSQISSPPVEKPSTTGDALFPMVLVYADLLDASIYCGYYAYMIIIHEALKTFGYPGPQEAMVIFFRDQICKSIEYATTGILGPYRMGFAVRVAIETADPLTRAWLVSHLQEFSKTYAAAKPENFTTVI